MISEHEYITIVKLRSCTLLYHSMKLRGLLEYFYAGLWEFALIVKVYF